MLPGQNLHADIRSVMLLMAGRQTHESHTSMYGSLVFGCHDQAHAVP